MIKTLHISIPLILAWLLIGMLFYLMGLSSQATAATSSSTLH